MIGDALLTPEPFFCTLAIYDAFKRRKLSEDFHFDAGLSGDYKCVPQPHPTQALTPPSLCVGCSS